MSDVDEIHRLRTENQKLRQTLSQLQAVSLSSNLPSLESFLKTTPLGMWDYNLVERYSSLSAGCARILGLGTVETTLTAEQWAELVHPTDKPKAREAWNQFLAGNTDFYITDYHVTIPSGTVKWILSCGRIVERDEMGQPLRVAGIHLDLTELRALQGAFSVSQTALQQSEDRWHFALEGNGDGVWDWNIEDNTAYFSSRWKEMLGYSEEDILNHFDEWASRVHPDDWETVIDKQMRHVRGETPNYIAEHRMRCKDGSYKWVIARGKVVAFTPECKPLRMVGTHSDISQRRANEEERLRLSQELAERALHLEAVNTELEAFSHAASHDLRAPIRSIEGFSQALLDDYALTLEPRATDYLHRIHKAANRMQQLLEALRQLSQITRADLTRQPVNFSQLAESVAQEIREQDPNRTVTITILPEMIVSADPTLLRIAITNLLENAFKFTSKKESATIEVGAFQQNSQTTYFIKDNGAGFDQEYVSKLFRPFQRLHSITEFEGTGIGLATVQRIIHRHGGSVWAEGHPDQGATLFFQLPF